MAPRLPSSSGVLRLILEAASRQTLKVPIRLISMTLRYTSRSWAEEYSPSRPTLRPAHPMPAQFTTLKSGAWATAGPRRR